jgi:SM-20-related protein
MIDLLEVSGFLDQAALESLVSELREAAGAPATVLSQEAGGKVIGAVRKSTRITVTPETNERVKRLLMAGKPALEAHFGVELGECEDPQFLRYEEGDYFVPHQDGNTPLVHDASRFRRISTVLFLSPRSEEPGDGAYGGGSLVLHGNYRTHPNLRIETDADPGTLVAFRSETTHEVTMVTHGVRYTVACFFRAPGAP